MLKNKTRSEQLDIYKTMLRIRLFEESLVDPILSGKIKTPCHLYSGQEAIAVGLCGALKKKDYIFGSHRSHGYFLAKGGSMHALAAEVYCRVDGCSRGFGGSMHLSDPEIGMLGSAPIVAGTISLAIGSALASSILNDNRVTVSFFGDGAVGEGVLYESMNFAALRNLPIIFACENNQYSTHMPIRECRVNKKSIYHLAIPFGVSTMKVDGNDVKEVLIAGRNAVNQCRIGEGPVFIEFRTYRLRGHVGPDDNIQGTHTDIRPKEEIELWRRRDPVKKYREYLINNYIASKEEIDAINDAVTNEVADAHKFAVRSLKPNPKDLLRYVFA